MPQDCTTLCEGDTRKHIVGYWISIFQVATMIVESIRVVDLARTFATGFKTTLIEFARSFEMVLLILSSKLIVELLSI